MMRSKPERYRVGRVAAGTWGRCRIARCGGTLFPKCPKAPGTELAPGTGTGT